MKNRVVLIPWWLDKNLSTVIYSSLLQYTFQAYSNPLVDHQLYDMGEFGKDFSYLS